MVEKNYVPITFSYEILNFNWFWSCFAIEIVTKAKKIECIDKFWLG